MIQWKGLFLNNPGLKLLSLLFAGLLWYQVASQQMVERRIAMPVSVVNLPDHLAIANKDYPRTVLVKIRTPKDSTPENLGLSVVVDLRNADPGKWVEATPDEIPDKPSSMEALQFVNPPIIELQLEEKVSKLVMVEIDLDGEPAPNFEVTRYNASPPQVMVSGPKSAVEGLDAVKTIPVSVEGHNSLLQKQVGVFSSDDRVLILGEKVVTAIVNIEEKRREIALNVPVSIDPPDPGAQLRTTQLQVVGTVPVSYPGVPKIADFHLTVSTEGLEPQRQNYSLTPNLVVSEELSTFFRLKDPLALVQVRKRR